MHNNQTHIVEAAMGAAGELARRSGYNVPHAHGMAKAGEQAVKAIARIAPSAVAAGAAATGTVIAAASALAPVAVVVGVGFGVYKLLEWANSDTPSQTQ